MENAQEKQGNIIKASMILWLVAIFLLTLFCFRILSVIGEEKVTHKYSKDDIGQYVTLIGDSISKGAETELEEALPGADIEAVNGIAFSEYREGIGDGGFSRLKKHAMRKIVVYLLGTNGGTTDADVSDLIDYVGPQRKLVLMTSYRETAQQSAWNAPIYACVKNKDNVYLVDWYNINASAPDRLLKPDHVHPNEEGKQVFANLVRRQVREALELSE